MLKEGAHKEDDKARLLAAARRTGGKKGGGKKGSGKAGASRPGDFGAFLDLYYRNVPAGDLAGFEPSAIAAIAQGHLTFGQTRKPGRARVRAFNPSLGTDGWAAARTVLEIVTDDMPFLVDSIMAELNRHGLTVHLVIHPAIHVARDGSGTLTGTDADGRCESFMHFQVSQIVRNVPENLKALEDGVSAVLADVRAAVEDWSKMRARVPAIINDLAHAPRTIDDDEIDEACAFLQWLHDDQFTFLGYRQYAFRGTGKKPRVEIVSGSGIGILRDDDVSLLEEIRNLGSMPKSVQDFVSRPDLLVVTKSNRISTVHRAAHMDHIGIKVLDEKGKVVGEHVFAGLFTSTAYNRSPRSIPLLRRKINRLEERAGFAPASHDGKAFINILETYPRDELFQASEDDLYKIGLGILHLQERQRVALFMRMDDFERFASCLIFIPRDGYTTDLRLRIQAILAGALNGEVTAHFATLGDAPLARLHVIVRTQPGAVPHYDVHRLEARIAEEARSWGDRLQDALVSAHGEQGGVELAARYAKAFPHAYRERFDAEASLQDIEKIEETLSCRDLCLRPYRPAGEGAHRLRFKVYHPETPLPLSDVLPMLEHLGLRVLEEIPFATRPMHVHGDDDDSAPTRVMIHDFGVETRSGAPVNLSAVSDQFCEAFYQVWSGAVESDGFNALILNAGLNVREISLLRAYAKYLRQAGITYSQAYMEETLIRNAGLAGLLVQLFQARFAPDAKQTLASRDRQAKKLEKKILDGLEAVSNADEDRIVRRFMNLVLSTLRTNYYQMDGNGNPKPYISFKLDSRAVDDLPLPRPLREIFICSPRVEGVHLRFGLVARGGLRWSDRREDFRTEVLGLVKAQQVKNAVIVPVGSKGGFVMKNPPRDGGRDAFMAEGIACYQTFIHGLLEITDNLNAKGAVVPPKNVVRHDGDDPYLVVAADKGTATFSDIANAISAEHGFWLGDAFASGGSQGYDHKKMGITARGGWESVKRHFREMGMNIQKEDFTVVGVGDMSGDVFGNGMLLSRHIKLVGAFNHMHIFVDPDPDPAKSFAERKRLFKKARSTWMDYDAKVMSKGGRIFERSAKTLTLTPEIKSMLGLSADKIAPNDLIRALLKHNADLLWFGGIGTYIKASHQGNADVGDRTNDQIRINATDLSCRVIGEGANLGLTQHARIEYALEGGRLNTDSVDNSAGVDCSDHEVNIKILLDQVVAQKKLSGPARNKLLADMTDDVAEHVLRDNYLQTLAITLVHSKGTAITDHQMRLMRLLERMDRLNREVENLPDDETLSERVARGQGLTRPEISVLISYSKIWLYDEILASNLPDDPELTEDLVRYFPDAVQKKYAGPISSHRLKREIITTRLTNSMINRAGGTFVTQHMEKTGMNPVDIARAYTVTAKVFDLRDIWAAIEALDNRVPAQVQTAMLLDVNKLVDRAVTWLLRNAQHPINIGNEVATYRAGIAAMTAKLKTILPRHYQEDLAKRAEPYVAAGVPKALAHRVTGLLNLAPAFDIVHLAGDVGMDAARVGQAYYAIGTRFRLGHLRAACERLETETHWQKLAVAALLEEIFAHQAHLCAGVLRGKGAKSGDIKTLVETWVAAHQEAVDRTDQMLAELWVGDITDLAMVTVASRGLGALANEA